MKQEIVQEFRDSLSKFNIPEADIERLNTGFSAILDSKCAGAIWQILGTGTFKECYDVGCPSIIVKFAANDNETWREIQTFELADDYGVLPIFLRTEYIYLKEYELNICWLDTNEVEGYYHYFYNSEARIYERGSWHENSDYPTLNYAIIQERCSTTANDDKTFWNHEGYNLPEDAYNADPIYFNDGTIVPWAMIYETGLDSYDWVKAVIKFYGDEFLKTLFRFIIKNNIHDLHTRNVGYMEDGRPIILDWQS